MKTIKFLVLFLTISTKIFTIEYNVGHELNINNGNNYSKIDFKINHQDDNFEFIADVSMINDDKYSWSQGKHFWYYYFIVNNGGIKLNFENIEMEFGRLSHNDEIDSPYSLFISSKKLPAIITNFRYENDSFIYQTRWIRLNKNSALDLDYPDRGANYQLFGLKWDNFRFGYQQSIIYWNSSFEEEFFFNPVPNFLVQYMNNSEGTPWQQEDANYNSLMGFFLDYDGKKYYLYSQILVDDLNANRFLDPENPHQNPDKIAWTWGGRFNTEYGKIGLHNAFATKYTYQTSGTRRYSYTYYPDTEYPIANNELKQIELSDNYIGYYHGENSLSFMIDYEMPETNNYNLNGSLEYAISGSKSPVNPWGKYPDWTDEDEPGTKFLDSNKLESHYELLLNLTRDFEKVSFNMDFSASYVKNKLELMDIPEEYHQDNKNDEMKYYLPSNNDDFDIGLAIGVSRRF